MLKRATEKSQAERPNTGKRQRQRQPAIDEEEAILSAATIYLIRKHGMFLVATNAREARVKTFRVWIITVTLRYATGDEAYIGDLLYDGEEFTFLTEQSVMDQRARQFADDPERIRRWNEDRDSTLRPGKA